MWQGTHVSSLALSAALPVTEGLLPNPPPKPLIPGPSHEPPRAAMQPIQLSSPQTALVERDLQGSLFPRGIHRKRRADGERPLFLPTQRQEMKPTRNPTQRPTCPPSPKPCPGDSPLESIKSQREQGWPLRDAMSPDGRKYF